MILYKNNKYSGEYEMSIQEIADSFIENGKLDYDHMSYYGLRQVIVTYISTELGSWDCGTATERYVAIKVLNEIYDIVKARLKTDKLGLWGPKS